jgi:hypothetical protein
MTQAVGSRTSSAVARRLLGLSSLITWLLVTGCQTPDTGPLSGVPVRIMIIEPVDIEPGEQAVVVIVLKQPASTLGQKVKLSYTNPHLLVPPLPSSLDVQGMAAAFEVTAAQTSHSGTVTICAEAVGTSISECSDLDVKGGP